MFVSKAGWAVGLAVMLAVAPVAQAQVSPTRPAVSPTKPAPTKPAPTKPAATKPAPTKPAPTKPAPTKPLKLSWKIPVARENGAPLRLADLSGYELYYISDDEKVSGVIRIGAPDQVTYAVSNLKAGTYHFAIAAVDARGVKSKLSKVVSAQVRS